MTAEGYRWAIAELGLSQVDAAKALGINPRTSRRYALNGVPEKAAIRVRTGLDALSKRADKC